MKSKQEILKYGKKCLKESKRNLGRQRENTNRCRSFEAGDYMEYQDKIQIATTSGQKKRVTVQINKVKPYTNAVIGFLAQNRREPNYRARIQDDVSRKFYSMYAQHLSNYMRGNMNAEQIETQQDRDLITCGIGAVETALSYGMGYMTRHANGEAIMGNIDLDTFWYDCFARGTNLNDARYMGISKIYNIEDAKDLFSDNDEEHFESAAPLDMMDYQYRADIGHYDRLKYDWADQREHMVNVHFFHWYDIETFYRADSPVETLQNPASKQAAQLELQRIAQEMPLDEEGNPEDRDFDPAQPTLAFNKDTKKILEESFGEFIDPQPFKRKVFYTAIFSGDHLFTAYKCIHQNGFPIKVKTGDFDAKNKIWTGMINSMMEPQRYYNKFLTELMFVISANSKGGVMIEEDAVEDIEEFEDQYAKTDVVCVMRPGALSNATGPKIKPKREPFQPTGYEQLIQIVNSDINEVTGIDKTFLGSSENGRETAQLQRQRIRQITSSLARYTDSIHLYQIDHARLMLDLMRVFAENNRGDLFQIIGKNGAAEFVMLSEAQLEPEFDVEIGEEKTLPEEREELADKMSEMGDKYLTAGNMQIANQFYALAAKYSGLDYEDQQQIIGVLTPQEGQIDPQQVQQMMQELQQLKSKISQAAYEHLLAETRRLIAEANQKNAAAQREIAGVGLDHAKSQKDIAGAALDRARAVESRAGVHKKAAETAGTLETATKQHLENKHIKAHPEQAFNPQPAGAQ